MLSQLLVPLVALEFERGPALLLANALTPGADRVIRLQQLPQRVVVAVAYGVDQAHLLVHEVDETLVETDHRRWECRELARHLVRGLIELVFWDDTINQAHAQRILRCHHLAQEEQLFGLLLSGDVGSDEHWNAEAVADLDLTETLSLGRDSQVAHSCQLASLPHVMT